MKKEIKNSDLERINAAWNKLEPLMDEAPKQNFKLKLLFIKKLAIAASLILISSIVLILFIAKKEQVQFITKYGQTLKIVLPDSSTVYLNGNSKLSYINNWDNNSDREVKVDGEAYFSVKHTKSNQKFFVRMADNLSVEVLGTEFNITKRGKNTQVVLSSGKIDFHMDNLKKGNDVVQMKPGDLIEYQNNSKSYIKQEVDPTTYSSWKSNRIIFDKTKIIDVLQNLQYTYGLKVKIEDEKMLNMRVSGSAPTNNIKSLVHALSETFNVKFVLKGDSILLKNKQL
jgi:ferric-dicitrate binding protein FerR (iron transport regulator)